MNSADWAVTNMIRNEVKYFDFFENLLCINQITVTGDLSPSYCMLSAERLSFIRDKFMSRGITVKPLILVRDPLERAKSAIQFNLVKRNFSEGILVGETCPNRALLRYIFSEHAKFRAEYARTIKNAMSVFGEENTLVLCYEELFNHPAVTELSTWLGITVPTPDFNQVVNSSPPMQFDTDLMKFVRNWYRDTYKYIEETYPRVSHLWTQHFSEED